MPPSGSGSLDRDALAHSVAWALLAVTGWWLDGWYAGIALLFGPTVPMLLVTWHYLVRRGEIAAARVARWLVLAAAALAWAVWRVLV